MEVIDLYDNKKRKLNKTIIRGEGKLELGEYTSAVHVWIMNSNGEFLIQKRSNTMARHPGKWECPGGAIDAGETSLDGAIREVNEELGFKVSVDKIEFLLSYKKEHLFVDVWLVKDDININKLVLQEEEVSAARLASLKEINELIKRGEFVPIVDIYYELFLRLLSMYHDVN
jgi:mutator protein MutT